jgi:DNA/RNA-binding domain of Phe-tRNA-synthetase-like protein
MTFAIDETLFSVMMNYCVGFVLAEGVQNGRQHPEVEQLLAGHMAQVREKLGGEPASQSQPVQPYREAYEKLGMDPDQYSSSIEYLLSQASRGRGIPMINPISDLVTAISLKYLVPIGAYDMDAVDDRLDVRFTEEGDVFNPYGEGEGETQEAIEPGEVVYASGRNVKTRKWIWRQSERGKIKEDSSRLILPIDGFEGINKDRVIAARDELASYLSESFGAAVSTGYLNYAQNVVTTE